MIALLVMRNNIYFQYLYVTEIKERKTWNERVEGTAERGMYGQRVWERSVERTKVNMDRSAQKPRESIKNNDIDDDGVEQPISYRNQCN